MSNFFKRFFKRSCVLTISLSLVSLGAPMISHAGIIGTAAVVESAQRTGSLTAIQAGLERIEVRERLAALGVEPAQIQSRLALLSDAELEQLAQRMESMPAGGSVLAVVGVVFVVLLILELTGVIDIFKKT